MANYWTRLRYVVIFEASAAPFDRWPRLNSGKKDIFVPYKVCRPCTWHCPATSRRYSRESMSSNPWKDQMATSILRSVERICGERQHPYIREIGIWTFFFTGEWLIAVFTRPRLREISFAWVFSRAKLFAGRILQRRRYTKLKIRLAETWYPVIYVRGCVYLYILYMYGDSLFGW